MGHSINHGAVINGKGPLSERELRESGIPPAGDLGDAKGEGYGLMLGVATLALIVVAIVIDMQL